MFKYCRLLIASVALAQTCVPLAAQQTGGAKVGVLTCQTSASLGLLVGSHQKIRCSFKPDSGGAPENYVGHINRLGIDIGVRAGGVMAWGVFAPTNGYHHGALAGKYVGGLASVLERMPLSADRTARSRCNRSRSKVTSVSIWR